MNQCIGWRETPVGYELSDTLSDDIWADLVRLTSRNRSSCQWRLGDLVRHGKSRYGERYDQVMAATGLRYQTLANLGCVAAAFEISRRRESLPFSFHEAVVSFSVGEQDRLLDFAEKTGCSREAIRAAAAKVRESRIRVKTLKVSVTSHPAELRRIMVAVDPVVARPFPVLVPVVFDAAVTHRPLFAASPEGTEVIDAPIARREPLAAVPEGTAVIDAPRLENMNSPPTSLAVIGGRLETETFAAALHALEKWGERFGSTVSAEAAGHVRQAQEAIQRQISGAKNDAAKSPAAAPRRRLH